jgi:hypothetical protein
MVERRGVAPEVGDDVVMRGLWSDQAPEKALRSLRGEGSSSGLLLSREQRVGGESAGSWNLLSQSAAQSTTYVNPARARHPCHSRLPRLPLHKHCHVSPTTQTHGDPLSGGHL